MDLNIKSVVSISSKDKDNSVDSTHNFSVSLDCPINTRDYDYIKIINCRIPNTFYNINSNCNTLSWVDGSTQANTTTITAGNYSITELISALQTALNADKAGGDSNTYQVAINSITEKITISLSAGSNNFSFTAGNLSKKLGFYNDGSGATSYTADNIYNLYNGLQNIFVSCDFIGGLFSSKNSKRRFLLSLPTENFGTISKYKNEENLLYRNENSYFGSVRMALYDEDYNPLDLNGANWSIQFGFI